MVSIGAKLEPTQLRQRVPFMIILDRLAPGAIGAAAGAGGLWGVHKNVDALAGWSKPLNIVCNCLLVLSLAWIIVVSCLIAATRQKPRMSRWVAADARTARHTVPYRLLQRLRLLTLSAIGATAVVFASLLVMASQGQTMASIILAAVLLVLTVSIVVMRVRQTRPEPIGSDSVAVDCRKLARAGRCVALAWAPSDKNLPGGDPLLGYEAKTVMWSKRDEDHEPGTRRYRLWCIRSAGIAWKILGVQSIPLLVPCVLEIDGSKCRLLTGVQLSMPDEALRQGRAIGLDRLQLSMSDGTGVGSKAAHGWNDPRMPRWESGVVTAYLEYDEVGSDACEPMTMEELRKIR